MMLVFYYYYTTCRPALRYADADTIGVSKDQAWEALRLGNIRQVPQAGEDGGYSIMATCVPAIGYMYRCTPIDDQM